MGNDYSNLTNARDYISPTLLNGTTSNDTAAVWLNKVIHNIYEKLSVTSHQIYTLVTKFKWVNENSIKSDLSLRIKELNEYVGSVEKGESLEVHDFNSWIKDIRKTCDVLHDKGRDEIIENIPELKKLEETAEKFEKKFAELKEAKSKVESFVQKHPEEMAAGQPEEQIAAAAQTILKGSETDARESFPEGDEDLTKDTAAEDFDDPFGINDEQDDLEGDETAIATEIDQNDVQPRLEEESPTDAKEENNQPTLTDQNSSSLEKNTEELLQDDQKKSLTESKEISTETTEAPKIHEVSLDSPKGYSAWHLLAATVGGIAITALYSYLNSSVPTTTVIDIGSRATNLADPILQQQKADIATMTAELDAQKQSLSLEKQKFDELQKQLHTSNLLAGYDDSKEFQDAVTFFLKQEDHNTLLFIFENMVKKALENKNLATFSTVSAKKILEKAFQASFSKQNQFLEQYLALLSDKNALNAIYSAPDGSPLHTLRADQLIKLQNINIGNLEIVRNICDSLDKPKKRLLIDRHENAILSIEQDRLLNYLIIQSHVNNGEYQPALDRLNFLIQHNQPTESIKDLTEKILKQAISVNQLNNEILDNTLKAAKYLALHVPEDGFEILNQALNTKEIATQKSSTVIDILKQAKITPQTDFAAFGNLKNKVTQTTWADISNAMLDNIESKKLSTSRTCEILNKFFAQNPIVNLNKIEGTLGSSNFKTAEIDSATYKKFLGYITNEPNRIRSSNILLDRLAQSSDNQLEKLSINLYDFLKNLSTTDFDPKKVIELLKGATIDLKDKPANFYKLYSRFKDLKVGEENLKALSLVMFDKLKPKLTAGETLSNDFIPSVAYFDSLLNGYPEVNDNIREEITALTLEVIKTIKTHKISPSDFDSINKPLRKLPDSLLKANAYDAFLEYQDGCRAANWPNSKKVVINNLIKFAGQVTKPSSKPALNQKQIGTIPTVISNIISTLGPDTNDINSLKNMIAKLAQTYPKTPFNIIEETIKHFASEKELDFCQAFGELLQVSGNKLDQAKFFNALYSKTYGYLSQIPLIGGSDEIERKKLALDQIIHFTNGKFPTEFTTNISEIADNAQNFGDTEIFSKAADIAINLGKNGQLAGKLKKNFQRHLNSGITAWIQKYDNPYLLQTPHLKEKAIEDYLELSLLMKTPIIDQQILSETQFSLKTMELLSQIIRLHKSQPESDTELFDMINKKNPQFWLELSLKTLMLKPEELIRAINLIEDNPFAFNEKSTAAMSGNLINKVAALKNEDGCSDADKLRVFLELVQKEQYKALVTPKIEELLKNIKPTSEELTQLLSVLEDNSMAFGVDESKIIGEGIINKFAAENSLRDPDKLEVFLKLLDKEQYKALVTEKITELFKPYQSATYKTMKNAIAEAKGIFTEKEKTLKLLKNNEKEILLYEQAIETLKEKFGNNLDSKAKKNHETFKKIIKVYEKDNQDILAKEKSLEKMETLIEENKEYHKNLVNALKTWTKLNDILLGVDVTNKPWANDPAIKNLIAKAKNA